MYKVLLCVAYICSMQMLAFGSFVTSQDCMNKCQPDGEAESYVQCERGCRFFGLSLSYGQSEQGKPFQICQDDCTEAYGLVKDSTSCIEGCSIHKKMLDEATANQTAEASLPTGMIPMMTFREIATKTVDGLRMVQTRVVAFFIKDDQLIQIATQPQIFIDVPVDGGLVSNKESEEVSPRRDSYIPDDSFLLGRDRPEVFRDAEQQESRPRIVRIMRSHNIQLHQLLAVLCASLVLLIVVVYSLSLYRRALNRRNKQSNITRVLNQEPLKLVRPEDLTKLSLMEEDEPKQGFVLPSAKV